MPGPEFFQTVMGRQFYDATMPRIANALERIANALEEQNRMAAQPPQPVPPGECVNPLCECGGTCLANRE